MRDRLVGRTEELAILKDFINSDKPEFLAIYGRRRVGKTFLVRMFCEANEDIIFFNSTGAKDGSLIEQIRHFTQRIGDTFFGGVMPNQGKSWDETFKTLTDAINVASRDKKIVLFLDELPWMATRNSRLLQSLDYYWNQYWSFDSRIKLIVCGSSSSWIINKIINNKGGLHNRITRKILLEPFNLRDTKSFLQSNSIKLNNDQVAEIYMVTGGVPYYLADVGQGLSATQAVERLAFRKNSLLLREFDNLFASLFGDAESYIGLLRIIARNRYGISQQEIIKQSKLFSKGGRITDKLQELKHSGFIKVVKPYCHKKKGIYYRVMDEYTLFYFTWIEPIKELLQEDGLEKGYWQNVRNTPAWHSWSGYAFESICYKHLSQIRKKLEIPVTAAAVSWRYVPRKKTADDGAQIDLLFDRQDGVVTICEIKYSSKPFVIDKRYAANLLRKGKVFAEQTRIKKQQFSAMITAHGIKDNPYSDELITGVVVLGDLFKATD